MATPLATVAVIHGYDSTHVLTGHQLALVQVVVTHIVLARRLADVVRFMHGAIRSGRIEGCLSRGEDCSDRPDTV